MGADDAAPGGHTMSQVKSALMATASVLAVIFVLNQVAATRTFVQRALNG